MLRDWKPRVAIVSTLLFALTATSAFATKPKTHSPSDTVQTVVESDAASSTEAGDALDELVVTLELNQDNVPQVSNVLMEDDDQSQVVEVSNALVALGQKIKSLATRFIGTPYRWGGTTPQAFDCSGFTRYVYSKVGIHIPRTAREQYKAGKTVPSGYLKTGDLVFFDMNKGRVSHVGIYLGNYKFIHASTPKTGVKIDSLKSAYYRNRYVGGKRYNS